MFKIVNTSKGLDHLFKSSAVKGTVLEPIISVALKMGGFLAGGLARNIWLNYDYPIDDRIAVAKKYRNAAHVELDKALSKYRSRWDAPHGYYRTHFSAYRKVLRENPASIRTIFGVRPVDFYLGCYGYCSHMAGDVDIFFPDINLAKVFLNDVKTWTVPVKVTGTPSGAATELVYKPWQSNQSVKVQIVSGCAGSPEEVMSQFDLTNSMVAYTSDRLILNEKCPPLEEGRELHVDHVTQYTLSRAMKYIQRERFKHVGYESLQLLKGELPEYLNRIREDVPKKKDKYYNFRRETNLRTVKQFLTMLNGRAQSAEELIDISATWPGDLLVYDAAFGLMHRKFGVGGFANGKQ